LFKVKSKMPASPAVLKQHAPMQQPQQPQQQKQAQIIHHFNPQGPHHSYAPGSTGAAQTMAWLHVHYPGVIGENFENPIGLELSAATTARAHLVSSQPTGCSRLQSLGRSAVVAVECDFYRFNPTFGRLQKSTDIGAFTILR
jgi:hypothetical protein